MIESMSQGRPHMWTGMTARVRGPMASRKAAGLIPMLSSISTITGIAPAARTDMGVAM